MVDTKVDSKLDARCIGLIVLAVFAGTISTSLIFITA